MATEQVSTNGHKTQVFDQIQIVDLKDIQIDPNFNARSGAWVDDKGGGPEGEDEGFPGMVQSINAQGQDYPADVILNPDKKDARRFFLVTGFRRAEAVRRLHASSAVIPKLPAGKFKIVVRDISVNEAHALNIRENAEREDLKGADLAWGINRMLTDGMTDTDVAAQLGKSQGYISRLHRIMKLPAKYTKAWREGTGLDGKGNKQLTVAQMHQLTEAKPEDRDMTYTAFFTGGSGTGANPRGKNAWEKGAQSKAANLGDLLGTLVRENLMPAKVGESFGDFVAVVEACVKMGKKDKGPTVTQTKKVAKACSEAFVAARDLEEEEEEEEEETEE